MTRIDNLPLSVPQMDREHDELIAQANEFSAAGDRGACRAELKLRLTLLIEGFQHHFDSEEDLMRVNRFPGLKLHSDEHRKLMGQISGLRDGVGSGVVALCDALVLFVRLWVEQHVARADTSFAQFLHDSKIHYA
jgi:hemerythrin